MWYSIIIVKKFMRCMLINTGLFRRIEIQLLMNLTARAIGKPASRTWTRNNDEALKAYAEFSRDNLQGTVNQQILQQMNQEAFKAGRMLRKLMCLGKQDSIERVAIALYQNIGIELEGHLPGQLCFRRCYFSHFYTPQLCQAASALDDGILRGLAGNGRLTFQQRITEGCQCCLATFKENHDEKSDSNR